jgi:transposase
VTQPAVDTWINLRPVSGPEYRVSGWCSVPGCKRTSDSAHHIVRRSQVKTTDWVEIEGKVYANRTGLCFRCHDKINTGRNAIRLIEGEFIWCEVISLGNGRVEFKTIWPLAPQPPTLESLAQRASGQDDSGSETCPTCGQTKRRQARSSGGPRRHRKSWTVKVPADAEEDGAEVLDTLVDDLAPLLNVEPDAGGRYWVIVPALVYAQQDRQRFIQSVKGVGG